MIPSSLFTLERWWHTLSPGWQQVLQDNLRWQEEDAPAGTKVSLLGLPEIDCMHAEIEDLSPLLRFKRVESLHFTESPVADFSLLAQLPSLRELHATFMHQPDVATIAELSQLRVLDLSYPRQGFKNWYEISQLEQLEALYVNASGITTVADLVPLTNLRKLSLCFNPIPTEEVVALRELLPRTQILF
jgi:hypothetical protein